MSLALCLRIGGGRTAHGYRPATTPTFRHWPFGCADLVHQKAVCNHTAGAPCAGRVYTAICPCTFIISCWSFPHAYGHPETSVFSCLLAPIALPLDRRAPPTLVRKSCKPNTFGKCPSVASRQNSALAVQCVVGMTADTDQGTEHTPKGCGGGGVRGNAPPRAPSRIARSWEPSLAPREGGGAGITGTPSCVL